MTTENQFLSQIKIALGGKPRPPMVSYQKFIRSPYWKVVRAHVLAQKGEVCSTCGVTDGLHVHHTTYAHHGSEHLHWKTDLIVLCADCHLKHHQVQRAAISSPYPAKVIKYVPVKTGGASVLTLKALKKEAKSKGLKLPELLKQYMQRGYGWIDNSQPRKKKGCIDILVRIKQPK